MRKFCKLKLKWKSYKALFRRLETKIKEKKVNTCRSTCKVRTVSSNAGFGLKPTMKVYESVIIIQNIISKLNNN